VFSVAQICNLPYRRISFCGTSSSASALELFGRSADYKSAIRRITNLRYEPALCAKYIRGVVSGTLTKLAGETPALRTTPRCTVAPGRGQFHLLTPITMDKVALISP
jgi:hypothetical protein